MKIDKLFVLALIVLASTAHAFESKIEIYEQFDNARVVAFVSEQDIRNSPQWNPEEQALPLSVNAAIKAVRSFIHDSSAIQKLQEIEIRKVSGFVGYWHYLVQMEAGDGAHPKSRIYVVLMDGKVIPAIIEPETFK